MLVMVALHEISVLVESHQGPTTFGDGRGKEEEITIGGGALQGAVVGPPTGRAWLTAVGEGHAVHDGIVRAIESVGADLVIMGSHGRRGLEKLMLGSVTQRVLGVVRIPVLVVRD